jgi:hypothetical protein
MGQETWAIGVDLGGTKVQVAVVDAGGKILQRLKQPTQVETGPDRIMVAIAGMVRQLQDRGPQTPPAGVGVGIAGQINAATGVVRFAPNLNWREMPFRDQLQTALNLPVVVTNDVRAATWGEWRHGAGQGADDLICLFIGTGIGGGVVSGGRMLEGCTNTAGNWATSPPTSTAPPAPAATGAASRPWPEAGLSPAGPGRPSGTTPPLARRFFTPRGSKNRWPPKTSAPQRWPPRPGPTTPWPGFWWMRWPGP